MPDKIDEMTEMTDFGRKYGVDADLQDISDSAAALRVMAEHFEMSPDEVEQHLRELGVDEGIWQEAAEGWESLRWYANVCTAVIEKKFQQISISGREYPFWQSDAHNFFELDGVVFRFPVDGEDDVQLAGEMVVLGQLRGKLDLETPVVEFDGSDIECRPFRFIGYPKVAQGGKLVRRGVWARNVDSVRMARSIGSFLGKLHAMPVKAAIEAGISVAKGEDAYKEVDGAYRLVRGRRAVNAVDVHRRIVEQFFLGALRDEEVYDFRPALIHGHVMEHLLFDPGTALPSAVVGWSGARVGDPAKDLADVLGHFGPAVFQDVLEAYSATGNPEGLWRRILAYWGSDLLLEGTTGDYCDVYYTDLVNTQVRRMFGMTPKIGRRSMITNVWRLRPGAG